MGVHRLHKALFLLILCSLSITEALNSHQNLDIKSAHNSSVLLPPGFLFGTASSSYQVEGAYLTDGKGLNNWDVFTHEPGNIADKSNGDIAVDQYHRYLEDINLMSSLGVNSYRFSISWARILPKGRFGDVNLKGIEFYDKLIDALLLKGIKPFVTLSHFDFPHELDQRYGGWLSPQSQKDFAHFAEVCFKFFGDRVKHWVTFNEPNLSTIFGYRTGTFPPARCSRPFGNCTEGDSEKEPFITSYNIIMSHARAVDIYRKRYQIHQGGVIGIIVQAFWFEPMSNSTEDKLAVERAMSFYLNWFLEPIINGKYPTEMEEILGSTLPKFSTSDKEKLKTGLDFIGINHYTSYYVQDCIYSYCEPGNGGSRGEGFYKTSSERNGVRIGEFREPCMVDWQNVYPQGMEKIITYVTERYKNVPVFMTENGYGCFEDPNEVSVHDVGRLNYLAGYLDSLLKAVRKGVDVRGFFVWSLLDNFEWKSGYTLRFGIHHVDFGTLERTKKLSATWFEQFIAKHKDKALMSH